MKVKTEGSDANKGKHQLRSDIQRAGSSPRETQTTQGSTIQRKGVDVRNRRDLTNITELSEGEIKNKRKSEKLSLTAGVTDQILFDSQQTPLKCSFLC